ncbi:hypothetical protein A606_00925 [Corynebacterium terpenotabidum Y-11]|uniref:Uncharacterized protein n=2 Tax=Corynebacterium terpenotabidum TaxID=89154 RepID=S4XE15_9CORY|nr:hypothetical protein A606_00925 [Corynebacterium terpenotabidum Y-11]
MVSVGRSSLKIIVHPLLIASLTCGVLRRHRPDEVRISLRFRPVEFLFSLLRVRDDRVECPGHRIDMLDEVPSLRINREPRALRTAQSVIRPRWCDLANQSAVSIDNVDPTIGADLSTPSLGHIQVEFLSVVRLRGQERKDRLLRPGEMVDRHPRGSVHPRQSESFAGIAQIITRSTGAIVAASTSAPRSDERTREGPCDTDRHRRIHITSSLDIIGSF